MDNITEKVIKHLLSSHVGLVGTWRGYKLKNVGKRNMHHYRRNGRLYIVKRNKRGETEHILSEIFYKTIQNSCANLTSKMSKNANPQLEMELHKDFMTYQMYKNN